MYLLRFDNQSFKLEALGQGFDFEIPFIDARSVTGLGDLLAGFGERGGLKFVKLLAGVGVEETDVAVTAGGGKGFAVGAECDGVDAALRHIELGQFLYAAGEKLVEFLHLTGIPVTGAFGLNGFDVCGYFLGNIGGEDHDLARAIEATACGEGGAVLIKPHVKDASAHYRKRAEQIGVVADYPFGLAEDTEKLRGPIGAAH